MLKVEDGKHYTVSEFKPADGNVYKNYECARCEYSTLWLDKMGDHWEKSDKHQHAWTKPGTVAVEENRVPTPAEPSY